MKESFNVFLLYFIKNGYFFTRVGSKKRDLTDQSNNGDELKKPRDSSLKDSHSLNSSTLEDVFASNLKAPEYTEILLNCLNVENQMEEMMDLVKSA